jgi:phosphatidylinositol-3-phosphatase
MWRLIPIFFVCLLASGCAGGSAGSTSSVASATGARHHIGTVFLIMMENHNWTGDGTLSIFQNPAAPYINNVLLPIASHANNYNNPPGMHPSLPNYLWLEAGSNFGVLNDDGVYTNDQLTTVHLVSLLEAANISWNSYEERATQGTCPLDADWQDVFIFFNDINEGLNEHSPQCGAHIHPYAQLLTDLAANQQARYNFIVPHPCDSMHSPCNGGNPIQQGDTWLSQNVPVIMSSPAYKNAGVLFIAFDEADNGDGPIPMLVLSPFAKGHAYSNNLYYNHGSTLRTLEEIFGVQPLMRDAAQETDLSDLFAVFP